MPKVKLTGSLSHNGEIYPKGTVFEGDQALVDQLIEPGTAADPDLVVDASSQADAEAEAADIKAEAEADATENRKAAQEQATKLIDDVKVEADKIRSDAEAAAKAKGERRRHREGCSGASRQDCRGCEECCRAEIWREEVGTTVTDEIAPRYRGAIFMTNKLWLTTQVYHASPMAYDLCQRGMRVNWGHEGVGGSGWSLHRPST